MCNFEDNAEKAIHDARIHEDNYDYKEAIDAYIKAGEEYLKTPSKKILVLRCEADRVKNEVKLNRLGPLREFGADPYPVIIKMMIHRINSIEGKIVPKLKKDENYHPFLLFLMSLFRELETFFQSEGLTEQANKMYLFYMQKYVERLKYLRKNLRKGKSNWYIFIYPFHLLWTSIKIGIIRFFGIFFDYGLNPIKLTLVSASIFLIWGFLFYKFDLVVTSSEHHTVNIWNNIYFSLVSLTSLGTEEFIPFNALGKILHCMEAIIGLILLGILVSFFARRIR